MTSREDQSNDTISPINLSELATGGGKTKLGLRNDILPKDLTEHIQLGEHNLRRQTADRVIGLFVKLNAATLATVIVLFLSDVWLIRSGAEKPSERLIDGSVVKMLIGATTVQLGAAVVLIMASLFPRGSGSK